MPPPPTAPAPAAPRRRTIIKIIALLFAWLIAGATLNVALAWGCAVWNLQDQPVRSSPEQFGSVSELWGPLPPRRAGTIGFKTYTLARHVSGFPMRSMESYKRSSSVIERVGGVRVREIAAHLMAMKDPYLPLRVFWPGFAINTLFYAGALWVVINGPFALRRMIRRRRGRCPTCNYPIGQSPVCTECGAALAKQ